MPGPYFPNQEAAECGCYYPDVTRIEDNPTKGLRVLHCITHGRVEMKVDPRWLTAPTLSIPDDDWRVQERTRLLKSEELHEKPAS